jgi:predicted amidohydrolase YtcJ
VGAHDGATQCVRAAVLGVTASVFVDHLRYWGDVLVFGLFGEPVTPLEPFRTISVAMTRLNNAAGQRGWATRLGNAAKQLG